MSRVLRVLRAVARQEAERRSFCELGLVTSVFAGDDASNAQSASIELKDSGLAIPRVPVATPLTGAAFLPRLGDIVVVLFPRGDWSSPVIVGQVYSEQRRPPSFGKDEFVLQWPGDADDPEAKAVRLSVSADGEARRVAVELGGESSASLLVEDGSITLEAGGVRVRLQHASDSDGTVEVAAGGTSLSLAQDGDLTLESQGTLTIKAPQISIEGDTSVKINGQTVEIN